MANKPVGQVDLKRVCSTCRIGVAVVRLSVVQPRVGFETFWLCAGCYPVGHDLLYALCRKDFALIVKECEA